jgi:type I protein arginine methyltransferase
MYSLSGYGSMIADRVRIDAYAQAIRRAVQLGSSLIEIGTGPGVFAVLACQLGADRVYAIEPTEIIQVAREIAAANGFTDKIEFFEGLSTRFNRPVKADVVVSDLRGVLPFFQKHIPSIADARLRLLAPNGILIPRRDLVWAAIVEAPDTYAGIVDCWERNALGIQLDAARQLAVNSPQKARLKPEQMLAAPQLWATLDYSAIDNPDWRGSLQWTIQRAGVGHGVIVWFDTELADGIGFSNAPGLPEAIYGSMFFPWTEPVPLVEGQAVCLDLATRLIGDDYIWSWTTKIGSETNPCQTFLRFEQSQIEGAVLSPENLRRSASDYVPELSEEGRLNLRILQLVDGKGSLEVIARRLTEDFPERFHHWHQALSYAATRTKDFGA